MYIHSEDPAYLVMNLNWGMLQLQNTPSVFLIYDVIDFRHMFRHLIKKNT